MKDLYNNLANQSPYIKENINASLFLHIQWAVIIEGNEILLVLFDIITLEYNWKKKSGLIRHHLQLPGANDQQIKRLRVSIGHSGFLADIHTVLFCQQQPEIFLLHA